MRGFIAFFGAGLISVLLWAKGEYFDPKYVAPKKILAQKDLEEKDRIAKEKLFFNRVGAPTRPLRSMDDMITFLSGSWTFDQFADFVSYNEGMNINMDQQTGLDSWMDDQDKLMLQAYQKKQKEKH